MTGAFHIAIPARHAATRLPGKPLRLLAGRPLLQHVHERARESGASSVVIATDDARIAEVARGWGAAVCMTGAHHASGTERLAEVAQRLGWGAEEVIVNLQGDEPFMPPALLRQVAAALQADPVSVAATLCTPIPDVEELFDPNVVKVVRDASGGALYFSRAPVPWDRDGFAAAATRAAGAMHFRHIGLYAYRAGFLRRYVQLPVSPLERIESLEQLRILWAGERIHVDVACEPPGRGVDTPEDLARAEAWLEASGEGER